MLHKEYYMTPIRGKNINFRLRQVSQDRFELLYACRRDAGLNYNKSDIMSEAIDVLFEKEKNLINSHKKEPQK
jgi:hypothetical protein